MIKNNIMKVHVCITVDDVCPMPGFGADWNEPNMQNIKYLYEKYGCKFTFFVPSNYHEQYPLGQYKDWVDDMLSKDWIELAGHGHYHSRINYDPGCKECEFQELISFVDIDKRVEESLEEWRKTGYIPYGWKMPGWVASDSSLNYVINKFEYVVLHPEHNYHFIKQIENKRKNYFISYNTEPFSNTLGFNEFKDDVGVLILLTHIEGIYNKNNFDKKMTDYIEMVMNMLKNMESYECNTLHYIYNKLIKDN